MDGKMQQLANQLTDQVNIYKELEAKYHRAESKIVNLEDRLTNLDSEYCATEVLRDTLKSDKIKVKLKSIQNKNSIFVKCHRQKNTVN